MDWACYSALLMPELQYLHFKCEALKMHVNFPEIPNGWTIGLIHGFTSVNDVTTPIIVDLKHVSVKGWNGPYCCRWRQRHRNLYLWALFKHSTKSILFCSDANPPKIVSLNIKRALLHFLRIKDSTPAGTCAPQEDVLSILLIKLHLLKFPFQTICRVSYQVQRKVLWIINRRRVF